MTATITGCRTERDQFVFIWGGRYSQWAKFPMRIDGIEYATCEQFMMAEKARMFGDSEAEAAIMATRNPREQKALGRKVKNFDDSQWVANREHVAYRGNFAKFSQNRELRDMLVSSGDKTIAEASPKDSIWGIGMAEDDPYVTDMSRWGLNLLGKAIMRVRDTLRSEPNPAGGEKK